MCNVLGCHFTLKTQREPARWYVTGTRHCSDGLCLPLVCSTIRAQGRESTVVRVLAVPAIWYVILLLPRYQPSLCLRALVIRVSGFDIGLVTASLSLLKLRKINPCVNRTLRNSLRVFTVWATLSNLKSESAQNCPAPREGSKAVKWGGDLAASSILGT